MNADSKLWRIVPGLRLKQRRWNEETIIYNCGSGDVHLLNAVGSEALGILQAKALSDKDLATEVSGRLKIDNDEKLHSSIQEFINSLARLGLIRPF